MEDDRREATRHLACFPGRVGGQDEGSINVALIRDVSVTGALLLTRRQFEVGETIDLGLHVSDELDGPMHDVSATVVRTDRRLPEHAGLWPYETAVTFTEPQAELEARFRALAASQERLGLFRKND